MPAKKPKYIHTLICDDIREEVNNKLIFIGVYGPNILVPKIPFIFPKLCFVNYYNNITGGDSVSIDILGPSGNKLSKTINSTMPKDAKYSAIFSIYSPLEVKQEGMHQLKLVFNKDDKTKKEVKFEISLKK